jgi:hypothetical protein
MITKITRTLQCTPMRIPAILPREKLALTRGDIRQVPVQAAPAELSVLCGDAVQDDVPGRIMVAAHCRETSRDSIPNPPRVPLGR